MFGVGARIAALHADVGISDVVGEDDNHVRLAGLAGDGQAGNQRQSQRVNCDQQIVGFHRRSPIFFDVCILNGLGIRYLAPCFQGFRWLLFGPFAMPDPIRNAKRVEPILGCPTPKGKQIVRRLGLSRAGEHRQAKAHGSEHFEQADVVIAREAESQPKITGHREIFVVEKQMVLDPVRFVPDVGLFAQFRGVDLFAHGFQKLLERVEVDSGGGELSIEKLLNVEPSASRPGRNVRIAAEGTERLRRSRINA